MPVSDRFTYLFLDAITIIFPLLLSFDQKIHFWRKWNLLIPSVLITSTLYLVWDVWFTTSEVWVFNHRYLVGLNLFSLPLEEYLFFIVVPYACMFIYECLIGYFPNLPLNGKWTNLIMAGFTTTIAAYNYDRLYTFITFGLIGITLWYLIVFKSAIINKIQQHLFPAWLLSIIPMFYVNGVLTSKPVLIYNNLENLGIRIGSIPFEDFFYNYLYMLWMVIIFENLRLRNTNSNLAK